jgi:hypothetical protein
VLPLKNRQSSGEISFEEFWSVKEKTGYGERHRSVVAKVIKAENVLNAGMQVESMKQTALKTG